MRDAAVMLIIKEDRILAISRRYDKTKFGLPGGKVEQGETVREAAIRECFEETGVQVSDCTFIFRRDEPKDRPEGEDFHCYCFYALDWSGEPHNSEEGEVAWLTEDELVSNKSPFAEYNRNTLIAFRTLYPGVLPLNATIGD